MNTTNSKITTDKKDIIILFFWFFIFNFSNLRFFDISEFADVAPVANNSKAFDALSISFGNSGKRSITCPVVFIASDILAFGLISSLNHFSKTGLEICHIFASWSKDLIYRF